MISDDINSGIIAYLERIPDPRSKRGIRYRFRDLLLIAVYSVLAGHSDAMEMEYYAELNFEYFHDLIGIDNVPSHDTFSRIMQMTDVLELGKNISQWIHESFPDIVERINGFKVLHVDGKAVCAAGTKTGNRSTVYNMNAMYEGEGISLYVKQIGEKENEISALPDYLDLFNLEETIVTIDAIGCNSTVINKIRKKKGHYLVPVKDNQPKLKSVIEKEVKRLEEQGEFEKLNSAERKLKEHGRIEVMKMHIIEDTAFVYDSLGMKSFYGSVARIGVIDKKTVKRENGTETESVQRSYVITDVESISVENMLKIKLSHWNVEAQHWILDVVLNEDRKTARKGNAVPSASILRRFCVLMRRYTPEFENRPLGRFLMANDHDIKRIEKILFTESQKELNE